MVSCQCYKQNSDDQTLLTTRQYATSSMRNNAADAHKFLPLGHLSRRHIYQSKSAISNYPPYLHLETEWRDLTGQTLSANHSARSQSSPS